MALVVLVSFDLCDVLADRRLWRLSLFGQWCPRRQLLQRLGAWFLPLGLAVRASLLSTHSSPALLALKKQLSRRRPLRFRLISRSPVGLRPHRLLEGAAAAYAEAFSWP